MLVSIICAQAALRMKMEMLVGISVQRRRSPFE
jgi:hypothetical protein